jgi:hypothetical protein
VFFPAPSTEIAPPQDAKLSVLVPEPSDQLQVINTPTLTLPPQGGGDFFLIPICLPSPLVGEGRVRGEDEKGNSYTIEL